jgi:hypothetical protein
LGTFSTYSSTKPRSPPDSWLRRSRSTPCQAEASKGQLGQLLAEFKPGEHLVLPRDHPRPYSPSEVSSALAHLPPAS